MSTLSSRSLWLRRTIFVILIFIGATMTMTSYSMFSKQIDQGVAGRFSYLTFGRDTFKQLVLGASASEFGAADGYVRDGESLSPADTTHPTVTNLNPDLLAAIRLATTDAKADGIEIVINSGWRRKRYQQALFDEALVTYGTVEEATKWVQTPQRSAHVTGDAVDIGDTDADYWLITHGSDYGLCQTYANEIWHFELMVEPGGSCPRPAIDATAIEHEHNDLVVETESPRNLVTLATALPASVHRVATQAVRADGDRQAAQVQLMRAGTGGAAECYLSSPDETPDLASA